MTTKKKAKAASPGAPGSKRLHEVAAKAADAPEEKLRKAATRTATSLLYHPDRGIVRVTLRETLKVDGNLVELPGRDVDIALEDLDEEIRGALTDALAWLAEDHKAIPLEPKPTKEE